MSFLHSENLAINVVLALVGIALLIKSADEAVSRFVGLADFFKLSTTFVGMTVMSLATSIPEISAHLTASGGILSGALDYQKSSAIVLGAKVNALLDGRYNVSFGDVQMVAPAALRHRILLNFEGQAEGVFPDDVIADLLAAMPLPAEG